MPHNRSSLLTQRVSALYIHDENNRLLRVNEIDSKQPIPYFYFLRSHTENLWRFRYDVPDDLAAEIDALARTEPKVDNLNQPLAYQQNYRDLLEKQIPISRIHAGLAYTLPEFEQAKNAIIIRDENKHLLKQYFDYAITEFEDIKPIAAAVEDDVAVSICFCSRRTDDVAEAGLYTQEPYRKRGYALQVVRQWAIAVRASGRLPLYSTSQDNLASQAVAGNLGAIQYGADFNFIG